MATRNDHVMQWGEVYMVKPNHPTGLEPPG